MTTFYFQVERKINLSGLLYYLAGTLTWYWGKGGGCPLPARPGPPTPLRKGGGGSLLSHFSNRYSNTLPLPVSMRVKYLFKSLYAILICNTIDTRICNTSWQRGTPKLQETSRVTSVRCVHAPLRRIDASCTCIMATSYAQMQET